MAPVRDSQFDEVTYKISEIPHRYGPNVHLLSDLLLLSHLAKLCAEGTKQPEINELIATIYQSLLKIAVNAEFPRVNARIATRMRAMHPEAGFYDGPVIDPSIPVITVNLARAGTLPSHLCYTALNYFMDPERIRQDHVSIARTTDASHRVTGSEVSGHKIGGSCEGGILLFPDPMGATGSTLVEALKLYRAQGKPRRAIALHCIVTPEYLRKVSVECPELQVYAIRLDRGLSSPEILRTVPGTHWEKEKGLNDRHYIVPGGGGFGEILNNSYV